MKVPLATVLHWKDFATEMPNSWTNIYVLAEDITATSPDGVIIRAVCGWYDLETCKQRGYLAWARREDAETVFG